MQPRALLCIWQSPIPCEDYAGFCATTVKSKVDAKVTATNYAKKSW